jgi:hypothetical protein
MKRFFIIIFFVILLGGVVYFFSKYRVIQKSTVNPPQESEESTIPSPTPDNTTTFINPVLKYQVKYPKTWTGSLEVFPSGAKVDYPNFLIRTSDYKMSDGQEGYPYLLSGYEIALRHKKTTFASAEEQFNDQPILIDVARNKKLLTVGGIEAVQYDFSYEGVIATMTDFIKDGVYYSIKVSYPTLESKANVYSIYEKVVASFKFEE